ncbi:o-methyltransferase domain-containing protein [Sarocladium implicatum]|nr:o-methyltransferase domain-containing protein [Sarocladium implicatum]
MATPQPTLNELAAQVAELTKNFSAYLEKNKIPEPTLAADSPTSYTGLDGESFVLRQKLLDTVNDLSYVVSGPSESIFNYVHNSMPDVAALNIMNHFNFWTAVPITGEATQEDIAKHTRLPLSIVTRLIEHGTTLRLFSYTNPGKTTSPVKHTSRSAALASNPGLRALVSTILDDAATPMTVMTQALEKHALGKETIEEDMETTAFRMLHNGEIFNKGFKNSWEYIEGDGEGEKKGWRQRNFTTFMKYLKDIFSYEETVAAAYDWKAAGDIKVVDIGGSGGHDAFVLADKFPNLSINVQDLPEVTSVFNANVPSHLSSRVTFTAHSFFNPQPVSADVYMLKLILHDWPDKESVEILRGLTPAMKTGSRVLFIDYVGKQGGEEGMADLPRSITQMGTSTDLRMMALFATRERPASAWKELFKKADERFDVVRVEANPMTFFVIIEAVWRG